MPNFRNAQQNIQIPEIRFDGIYIKMGRAFNLLGLTIDEQRNMNKHIQHISYNHTSVLK